MYNIYVVAAAMFHGTFETVFFVSCFPSGVCVHKSKIVYITIATVYRIYQTCSLYAIQGYCIHLYIF